MVKAIGCAAVAGSVLALAAPSTAPAQSRTLIPSEPACAACSIELGLVVKLGDVDEPGAIGRPGTVDRDGRGFYYVTSAETPGEIDIFDLRGRYVRTIGREGEGPGEYRAISHIDAVDGDTLLVFDEGNGRIAVLSPAWEVVRTSRFAASVLSLARLTDGQLVASGRAPTPESIGYPLHLVGRDGALSSFGAEEPVYRPDMFYAFMRYVAAAPDGLVWASHALQYVIELWDPSGRMLKQLVRKADWFPPQFQQRTRTKEVPDYPEVRAIRQDPEGRLWVLITVCEPDWYEGLGEMQGSPEGPYYEVTDMDKLWGTRIEVVDPEAGRVIASRYTSEFLYKFLDDRHAVGCREDDGGVPRRTVFELSLTTSRRR